MAQVAQRFSSSANNLQNNMPPSNKKATEKKSFWFGLGENKGSLVLK